MHVLNCRMLVQTNGHIPENASLVSTDLACCSAKLSGTDNKQLPGHGAQMHSGERFGGADSPAYAM